MGSPAPVTSPHDSLDSIGEWFRQIRPSKFFALTLSVVAITSGIATWVALTGNVNELGSTPNAILALIAINLVLLLALCVVIIRKVYGLWAALRKGSVGSRLHTRIVAIFSLVTILPTILISVFSAIFFHFGIKSWFDERVSIALEESVTVAEAYLEEHKETIRADAIAMSSDIRRELIVSAATPQLFNKILEGQAALRNLTEAIVFHPERGVIGRTELSFSLSFERLPQHVTDKAALGNIVIMADEDNKIRALIRLDDYHDLYLLIGRLIKPEVLNHTVIAQGAVNEYRRLQQNISTIQIQFSIVFVLVTLLLLLAAIWYGMYVATRLLVPVTRLIGAAERVRAGDFSVNVPEGSKKDEISTLSRTFNRMTTQLQKQREELVEANSRLDERRRFIETVFSGVSAGVLALDPNHRINLFNRSARQLLGVEADDLADAPIGHILPEITDLIEQVDEQPDQMAEKHIAIQAGERQLRLHVRVTAEQFDETIEGYIVTFDDITELVSAQRTAAWSDVARRIAHEIKNPLTPITLSVERLKRKYADKISDAEDQEQYRHYLDTISRHVGDIGSMVEEFVSFARMPAPVLKPENLYEVIEKIIFSERTTHPEIGYVFEPEAKELIVTCDEQKLGQVFTNLLKNAAESMESLKKGAKKQIHITVKPVKTKVTITIHDSGPGFPPDKIATLTEPYVTTRAKGTGLGLAIVRKTMEDHKGSLELSNHPDGGACVKLSLPL